MPLEQWPQGGDAADEQPWGAFVAARQYLAAGRRPEAIAQWQKVLEQPDLEPRCYLQAWHFLRQQEQHPPAHIATQLLGVVVEVAMPEGLDLVAAYSDHSARYYNYSGAGVIWEHPDSSLDSVIDELLEASRNVVAQIGPWNETRPGPPPPDSARLSFLTPSGLHFGQGPYDALSRDRWGGPVLNWAFELLTGLSAKTGKPVLNRVR